MRSHKHLIYWLACPFVLTLAFSHATLADTFEDRVAPILNSRCMECHNANEKAGGLDLSTESGLRAGGETGSALDLENLDASLILERTASGEMPPRKQGKSQSLTASDQEALRSWVLLGSPWPKGRKLDPFESTTATHAGRDWWSLQPIQRPIVPKGDQGTEPINPIDAFIRAGLDQKGWKPAPEADRRTLIRRVAIDLIGIPPSFEETQAFVNDSRPDAYERLVDRLLASPHFGERWGRFWLDLVRYAETSGYERDQVKPFAWKYRDWVVRALNEDMPLDQFISEQLAGDEVSHPTESSLIATGFIRLGTWNDEPNDPQEYKYERLEDMVHATSTAFLGMTVKCARCHDHKFDPILQADYYRMAAAFWAGPIEPAGREWLGGPDPKLLPDKVLGWTDIGRDPVPLHLLKKGEPNRPGPVIEPGPLSMVPLLDQPFVAPPVESKTSKRRLQLAQWITNPKNPLTARVWVNRLWQHHFGQGLSRSPDNFGFTGEKPTHPELLDWLASELLANGKKSKPLHKLILLSQTYKQSSIHLDRLVYEAIDAGNQLLWHAERRRLDAESLRDAILFAAGRLDSQKIGGPSFLPNIPADALEGLSTKSNAWTPSPAEEQNRRGIYIFAKRGLLSPLMTTFDFPDTTLPCGQRDVTLVAPQALALLNNSFVHEQSDFLSKAIVKLTNVPDQQVNQCWTSILGRLPTPTEQAQSIEHLDRQTRRFAKSPDASRMALGSLCLVLMNSNEMLFID